MNNDKKITEEQKELLFPVGYVMPFNEYFKPDFGEWDILEIESGIDEHKFITKCHRRIK